MLNISPPALSLYSHIAKYYFLSIIWISFLVLQITAIVLVILLKGQKTKTEKLPVIENLHKCNMNFIKLIEIESYTFLCGLV